LNTTLTPHSIIPGDACFAYFNKIWGIPPMLQFGGYRRCERPGVDRKSTVKLWQMIDQDRSMA